MNKNLIEFMMSQSDIGIEEGTSKNEELELEVFTENLNIKKNFLKFETLNTRICQIYLDSGEYVWIKKDTVVN